MGGMYDHSQTLVDLINERQIGTFAEIGVWKGKTARFILRNKVPSLKIYWGIDQYKRLDERHGHMSFLSCEDWDGKYLRECQDMYYFDRFRIVRAPSLDACKIFPDQYFDLVFIDGSHFGKDVIDDINAWLPKVKIGGMLAGHDYNSTRHTEVKPAVDKTLPNITTSKLGLVWQYEKKTP